MVTEPNMNRTPPPALPIFRLKNARLHNVCMGGKFFRLCFLSLLLLLGMELPLLITLFQGIFYPIGVSTEATEHLESFADGKPYAMVDYLIVAL